MKSKRLTVKEKKIRAQVRKDLRADGMIPPIKKRLNRRKFVKEVRADYNENIKIYDDIIYLVEAITWMLPSGRYERTISPEEIGIAKVLKMAVEIKKFSKEKIAKGEKKYSIDELYNTVIEPIRNL